MKRVFSKMSICSIFSIVFVGIVSMNCLYSLAQYQFPWNNPSSYFAAPIKKLPSYYSYSPIFPSQNISYNPLNQSTSVNSDFIFPSITNISPISYSGFYSPPGTSADLSGYFSFTNKIIPHSITGQSFGYQRRTYNTFGANSMAPTIAGSFSMALTNEKIILPHKEKQENDLNELEVLIDTLEKAIPSGWTLTEEPNEEEHPNACVIMKITSDIECSRCVAIKPDPCVSYETINPYITIYFEERWTQEQYDQEHRRYEECVESAEECWATINAFPMMALSCPLCSIYFPDIDTLSYSIFIHTKDSCENELSELKRLILEHWQPYYCKGE